MAVGLGQVAKLGLAADDRDRRVGQAGEIALQVAHTVQVVLNVPVVARQGRELLRSGPLGGQRGECVGHFSAGLAAREQMPLALDAEGLLASVEASIAVPLRVAEVLDPIGAATGAAMLLVEGLAAGQALQSMSRRSSSMVGWLSWMAVIR